MITQRRIQRLRKIIENSRERLLREHPAFAIMLMYLKYIAVTGIRKISTNGRCIYFSPDYLEKLDPGEVDFVLCHQIMHLIRGDLWKESRDVDEDFHFACDIANNARLLSGGIGKDSFSHFGQIHKSIPGAKIDCRKMTPEEVIEKLPFSMYMLNEKIRRSYFIDESSWWKRADDYGEAGIVVVDIPEDKDMLIRLNGKGSALGWQGIASEAAEATGSTEDTNPILREILEQNAHSEIDWRVQLNTFLHEQITDYSFAPPDRRFGESMFFLPDFNDKEYISEGVLFMVDTSGSIDMRALGRIYAEIRSAIEQFNGKLYGELGFFDTNVIEPVQFESIDDIGSIVPYGGGGTDFRCIFDYLNTQRTENPPASIVIFTDGYGTFPEENSSTDSPVLWVLNNNKVTPPWGTVCRYSE